MRSINLIRPGALLFSLALTIVAACGDDSSSSSNTTAGPAAGDTTAVTDTSGPAGTTATEVIQNVAFRSAEVRVAVGGTVLFDNQDNQKHTATADDRSFDTGAITGGEQASVTFDTAGTVEFHCSLHPFMTAKVVVG